MRYKVDETEDGLKGQEGSFTSCSFWLVSTLVESVSRPEPDSCERLLCCASPLGLYAEEIDTETGRHPGNFPQAFTYLALINALLHLIEGERAEEEEHFGIAGPPPH